MAYEVIFFVALLATALALGGGLAHALELPNKIGMGREEYFTVQQIYTGWNRLAVLLVIQLVSIIAVAAMSRGAPSVMWPAILAGVFLLAAQAVFWTWTYPANVATKNWTLIPAKWQALRAQWEYSHAAGAGFQVLAMASLIVAVLARGRV